MKLPLAFPRLLPRLLLLLLIALTSTRTFAQEIWTGSSDVTFKGYSTLHDFEGNLKSVPLKVTVSPGRNGRIVSATSEVTVKQMTTHNTKRDESMLAMFHEAANHFIKVEVIAATEASLRPQGGHPGAMQLHLTIAGKRGTVNGAVTNLAEQPEALSFDLKFPVSLAAFNLEPPKAMAGVIKVKDTVDVSAHVTLKQGSR